MLTEVFGFHPLAVRDCVERNRVPKVHAYPDHVFVVLHAPERGERGHVHYVELDQFVGPRTTWSPCTGRSTRRSTRRPPLRETRAVLQRIEAGRLRPATPFELSYAIVSALTRNQEAYVATLTSDVVAARAAGHRRATSAIPRSSSTSCSAPATGCSPSAPWPR